MPGTSLSVVGPQKTRSMNKYIISFNPHFKNPKGSYYFPFTDEDIETQVV